MKKPRKAAAKPKAMKTCAGCPMPSKCTAAGKCLAGDKGKALY
jgi:hypothetical protein